MFLDFGFEIRSLARYLYRDKIEHIDEPVTTEQT